MLRLALAALAAALLASPAGAVQGGYAFGRSGGNIAPYTVTVSAAGRVTVSGAVEVGRASLTVGQLAHLRSTLARVDLSGLHAQTVCAGTLPDFASRFVRAGGRTVAMRGSCSPAFSRAWSALADATGLAGS